jgi:hypothetical protein
MPPEEFTLDDEAGSQLNETLDALAQLPPVQQHAIDEAQRQQAAQSEESQQTETVVSPSSVKVDKNGVVFDEKIHTGSKLKDGTWRKRKVATETGSVLNTPKSAKKETAAKGGMTAEQKAAAARNAGAVCAAMMFRFGQAFGGEEFAPDDDAEAEFYAGVFGDYLLSKDVTAISPGFALLGALGMYAGSRATRPKTSAKISRIKTWFALRAAKWKVQKEFKKRGIVAQVEIKDGQLLVDGKEPK